MSWCRACHAEIRFAKTEGDSVMPLDAKPVPDGPIVLLGHPAKAHWLTKEELAEVNTDGKYRYRFMPHWKTCTKPEQFRRKRPAAA